jgi:hypothetical protein
MIRHLCPVCRRPIVRTRHHRICGHYDKAGSLDMRRGIPRDPCPGSFAPFDITIADAHLAEIDTASDIAAGGAP